MIIAKYVPILMIAKNASVDSYYPKENVSSQNQNQNQLKRKEKDPQTPALILRQKKHAKDFELAFGRGTNVLKLILMLKVPPAI